MRAQQGTDGSSWIVGIKQEARATCRSYAFQGYGTTDWGVIEVAIRIRLFVRVSKGQNPFKRHLLSIYSISDYGLEQINIRSCLWNTSGFLRKSAKCCMCIISMDLHHNPTRQGLPLCLLYILRDLYRVSNFLEFTKLVACSQGLTLGQIQNNSNL